jgi:hypothetical protein
MDFRRHPRNRKYVCYPRVRRCILGDLFVAFTSILGSELTIRNLDAITAWSWAFILTVGTRLAQFFSSWPPIKPPH